MRISSEHVVFSMEKANKPALSVDSGATVVFETLDCFSNTVQSSEDLVSAIDFSKVNPATGPLFVNGAEPGDTLKVTIHSITLPDQGVIVTAPGLGNLSGSIVEEETVICKVTDDHVEYKGINVPLRKMIGVIGTAPAGEPVNTGTPHDHGGNMDTTRIAEGASLYLPVNVEGALLAMGDLHAAMGDGEIMGDGLEIPGEVEVTVEVVKNFDLPVPLVETDDLWITIGSRATLEEAGRLATENMADLIQKKSELTFNQAGMLLSMAGNLHACQVVNPNVTMRMELAKSLLK
ncbi:acetamidase/formamidase family protein [Atopococcus tabaci]|uniref:acetamidase/formamidase family protein n=1 Tax=Atopococcus tabaci TaxID=269774 RepID=UPI0003F6BEB9|nr:acetamidase/formamidase family protein [Atopococcus tabaci]